MINILGKNIESSQKKFTVYPDISAFNSKILMADDRPAFLVESPLDAERVAELEAAGWTTHYDRLFLWKDATIGIAMVRQLFPEFSTIHIKKDVLVDYVDSESLINAIGDFIDSADLQAETEVEIDASDVAENALSENALSEEGEIPQALDASQDDEGIPKKKIEDAGKKIGGARKDRFKRLDGDQFESEIFSMGKIELMKDIKKRSLWNFNIQDEVAAGMGLRKAIIISELISGFPSWNPSAQAVIAKDRASRTSPINANLVELEAEREKIALSNLRASASFYAWAIHKFRDTLLESEEGDISYLADKSLNMIIRGMDQQQKIDAMLARSKCTPRRVSYGYTFNDYEKTALIANAYRSAKRNKYWDFTEGDYLAEMDAEKDKKPEPNKQIRDDVRPHLSNIERSGLPSIRTKNVGADDFISTFGFRGVEFGNWLPNDERQDVLNRAYDAFYTLSLVLGISPSDIGLKGIRTDSDGNPEGIALGFGSRGHGGRGAGLAHWEPAVCAMNLTRLNGAGSLAHEYGHALDQFCGMMADKVGYKHKANGKLGHLLTARVANGSSLYSAPYLTYGNYGAPLSTIISRGTVDVSAIDRALEAAYRLSEAFIFQPLFRLGKFTAGKASQVEMYTDENKNIEHVREMAANLMLSQLPKEDRVRLMSSLEFHAEKPEGFLLEAIGNIYHKEIVPKIGHDSIAMRGFYALTADYGESRKTTSSFYHKMAALADERKSRTSKYYTSPHEMFARAFESFVQDRLKLLGNNQGKDDYLVYGTDNGGLCYPVSHERNILNDRFLTFSRAIADSIDELKAEFSSKDMPPPSVT